MKIKEMFKDDIDRNINGVVQVGENEKDIVEQEVKEYVVTSELKKHYSKFFNEYSESFDKPTDKVGVWITGFFGSGKSHFLKMLSYLLENKKIGDKNTVDYFEEKFDDQLTFMNIQKCVKEPTETILFNIDAKSSGSKTDNSIMEVFYKVFYDHLGLFGSDLKVARLEQFIINKGKMDEFKEAFEEINGDSWENTRAQYDFFETDVEEALVQADVMTQKNAEHWFEHSEIADTSPESLVNEVKKYVDSKGKDFRLLFMIDEAGQFIGESGSMLLNLQSLVELFGSVCRGQVWVIATGQEALDDMAIKLREDEFSRIMARFPIRLSLTSSSVGEVIEKRLLTKTDEANSILNGVYENNENVLSNLYAFDTDVKDIKGYTSEDEFARIFPFVPYQFTIMQKVFNEIRKHGHAGKHQSSGERSMLNGFQESAQHIENNNELTLVPMYAFYDTLHSFLDTSVRSVIERAEKASNNGDGLTEEDVNLLKLLYLIRYIDDIKSNIENLTILMADTITVDKIVLRGKVVESLERLQKQNYISRNGDIYQFLTDEEQDIAREISNQTVDAANVISQICKTIFDDIYTTKKYRYTKNGYQYDFDFDKSVDEQNHGSTTGGMKLRFVTEANDANELKLITDSKDYEAICKLSNEYSVFSDLENVLKIDKFIKQKNVNQLPQSIQDIITNKQREARRLQNEAKEKLSEAIIKGKFYIDGTVVNLSGTSVKAVLDNALETLVEHTYSGLSLIDDQASSEADIRALLKGEVAELEGIESNKQACEEVYNYLDSSAAMGLHFTMTDIQSRYQDIPYGWREIDVAYVVAKLIHDQKVTIKHSGQTIQPTDYQLIDFLRKKSETSSTSISIRETISASKMKKVKDILKEYFEVMDVPSDEDGLVRFVANKFSEERVNLEKMNDLNASVVHPGSQEISNALSLIKKVLLAQNDNIALVDTICNLEDDLLDSKEDMQSVKNFYATQIKLFDNAVSLKHEVEHDEKDYLMNIPEIVGAIDTIKDITKITNNFRYNRIPELNDCISVINTERNKVVEDKKQEVIKLIDDCCNEVALKANGNEKLQSSLDNAKQQFDTKKQETDRINSLVVLDAKKNTIVSLKDTIINKMDSIINQAANPSTPITPAQPVSKKKVRELQRVVVFNQASLTNAQDVDEYLAKIKNKLLSYINDDEEIKIK
jgi:hypothetical protein